MSESSSSPRLAGGTLDSVLRFALENKLVVVFLVVGIVLSGLLVAPFDWELGGLPRDPLPADAIPDYGENQQIVFTEWHGRSPQDVEDQVTYPLTVSLLGIPHVKNIRSVSYFGFSSVHVIFDDDVDFYWSRSRIVEKLASLPPDTLPEGVHPSLGPDATPLGQIYWYTLEGRDQNGDPAGGWDLEELRSIQDWQIRYALMGVEGVSEVASVGGFAREYQIDVDPDSMRAHGVTLDQVFQAVRMSNVDVGARTIEVNRVEYVIRGLGLLESTEDIEQTVVKTIQNVPIRIRDVAHVSEGPALRRGALDKGGEEAVGGVVVVRYGANPLTTIRALQLEIDRISASLPKKILDDGTVSTVTIVPFYDRTGLIHETLGTLSRALVEEIMVTVIVVLLMVMHVRSSILISGLLPLAVLLCFVGMKLLGIDANVVALSGIAIAIGTIVDVGIVLCENILQHLKRADAGANRLEVIFRASREVAAALLTAILTTVISFLPVFTMEAAEGKLFKPLAYTKTIALIASAVVSLIMIPPFAHFLFTRRFEGRLLRSGLSLAATVLGIWILLRVNVAAGIGVTLFGLWHLVASRLPDSVQRWGARCATLAVFAITLVLLTSHWLPVGAGRSFGANLLFVCLILGSVFLTIAALQLFYEPLLRWCLSHKLAFLSLPCLLVLFGLTIWLGAERIFSFVPESIRHAQSGEGNSLWQRVRGALPGLGKEFMPKLSEGSFLVMPTVSPHASIGEAMDTLRKQDMAIQAIPEVDVVVGKIGRVESALDPAPVSMIETVVTYKSEYILDRSGRPLNFRYDDEQGQHVLDEHGRPIEDPDGKPIRQWRDTIHSEQDIWNEIQDAATILGSSGAPMLQPIETRLIMLQTGMRAALGIKVFGPDLESVASASVQIGKLLSQVGSIDPRTIYVEPILGKPYFEIEIDREAIARYGISVRRLQDVIEVAIGGKQLTTTIEGRERFAVRARYLRELRDTPESLGKILVPAPNGTHIPLAQLAAIEYKLGPTKIRSEDTRLVTYVTFGKKPEFAEVEVVETAQAFLLRAEESGRFNRPAGVSYEFSGSYENQVRSSRRLAVVLPAALFAIFVLLYVQFRSVVTTLIVFSGVFVAWSGGFQMLWLYGQDWFLDFDLLGVNLREVFHVQPYNLSVAVWVGFLALFGIATDDGVINATYLDQVFADRRPRNRQEIIEAVVAAGRRRIRPCLMTVATTILALVPVLTSTGRGADVMVPMAIPSFGGMTVALITVFIVPTLYALKEEVKLRRGAVHAGE